VVGELVSDIKSYRDLEVWRRAKGLALEFYRVTQTFPADEKFGLTSQIRRASVSVAANIAEGQARVHTGDFVRHLSIARGSLAEAETLLEIATSLEYLQREKVNQLWNELQTIGRMLTALIQSLEAHSRKKLSSREVNQPPTTSQQPPEQKRADKAQ
jgi:four helix bundle protein